MNIYHYFETEISSILNGLVAAGTLPADLDHAGISCETPRDPSHGDLATNAAMVLAKRAGMKPAIWRRRSVPALARSRVLLLSISPGRVSSTSSLKNGSGRTVLTIFSPPVRTGANPISVKARRSMLNMFRPIRPVLYMRPMPAVRLSATALQPCLNGQAIQSPANITSMMQAIRSIRWPGRRICGIAKHLAKKSARSPRFLSRRLSERRRSGFCRGPW